MHQCCFRLVNVKRCKLDRKPEKLARVAPARRYGSREETNAQNASSDGYLKCAFSTIMNGVQNRPRQRSATEARQVRTSSGGGQQRSVSFAGASPIYAIM